MKQTKFYNNESVLNVLEGSDKVLAGYARNEELVKALEKNDFDNKFPIFFHWLQRRFDDIVRK